MKLLSGLKNFLENCEDKMKFFHITVESDDLDVNKMQSIVGDQFGRYFIKGNPIYDKYTGKITEKTQKSNRWVYSYETQSNNINIGLQTFLKNLLSNEKLLPYLEKYGAVVEIVVYYSDAKSNHQITISKENIALLLKANAKLKFITIDF